jgi:hypothetical protein
MAVKFHIFGGCSFTDMHNSWARVIQRDLLNYNNSRNVSKSGAGNKFIASAVIDCALKAEREGFTPDISIMWSSPTRSEFPLHETETPYVDMLFQNNTESDNDMNPGVYALTSANGDIQKITGNYWLLNGGNVSEKTRWSNNFDIDIQYVDAFRSYSKFMWNQNAMWHQTLSNILLVQQMCELKGWEYRFTTFTAFVKEYKTWCADQFVTLQDEIHWNKFLFTDNEDGGLREYTLNNLNTWDDGYDNHPSYEAHEDFVQNFWLPHFKGAYT